MAFDCKKEYSALLCNIPSQWREALVDILCSITKDSNPVTCEDIKECETLTSLSEFTPQGEGFSVTYKDEKGQEWIRTIDFNTLLDTIDPKCVTTSENWALMNFVQRFQAVINKQCECCNPPTTTTSTTTSTSTTTTTTQPPTTTTSSTSTSTTSSSTSTTSSSTSTTSSSTTTTTTIPCPTVTDIVYNLAQGTTTSTTSSTTQPLLRAYYGWQDSATLPDSTGITTLQGHYDFAAGTTPVADFTVNTQPKYLVMFIPVSEGIKTHWYGSSLNNGAMGEFEAWATGVQVGSYYGYITNYQTQQNQTTIQFLP